jgi:hypothetical protein
MTIVSVLFADEAAGSSCLERRQPFAITQNTRRAAAEKQARPNTVEAMFRDFIRGLIGDTRYT